MPTALLNPPPSLLDRPTEPLAFNRLEEYSTRNEGGGPRCKQRHGQTSFPCFSALNDTNPDDFPVSVWSDSSHASRRLGAGPAGWAGSHLKEEPIGCFSCLISFFPVSSCLFFPPSTLTWSFHLSVFAFFFFFFVKVRDVLMNSQHRWLLSQRSGSFWRIRNDAELVVPGLGSPLTSSPRVGWSVSGPLSLALV